MFSKFKRTKSTTLSRPTDAALLTAVDKTHFMLNCTPDGFILSANAQFCRRMGFDETSIVGIPYKTLVRNKDHTECAALWAELAKGEPHNQIMPRLNASGEEVWLDTTYVPIKDDQGAVAYIAIIAREISEMHLRRRDNRSKEDAIKRSMAVIEFDLQGNILIANDHFLSATGYSMEELKGQHHSIFMPKDEVNTQAYRDFWTRLGQGASEKGPVKRIAKDGSVVWLESTYETLIDPEGRPFKVVKYAFDITTAKNMEADARGQIDAIQKVQAVIEFNPDGTIRRANDNFCHVMGYDESEIIGKHHRLFIDPAYAASSDYAQFWARLRSGEALSDEYARLGKNGQRITIKASYNPIRNAAGQVVKVVKFAVDTTIYRRTAETLMAGLDALAHGNLAVQLDADLGEFDDIRKNFNIALSKLNHTIGSVADSTQIIKAESDAIGHATDDLARRTEAQAATLEESASALDELVASVTGVANTAGTVQSQSKEAQGYTVQAGDVVDRAVNAMDEIENSSKQVASITSVIDDIAFQTNLLALNAGVEAARAGDAGRGFAVVASEVRALAQRSSDAAREIATLIDTSNRQVANGVDLVREAGAALGRIREAVEKINHGIEQVATSTTEQATGLGELSSAINQLDQTTQQNAAMSEETNAATVSLQNNIAAMEQDVSFFSVQDTQSSASVKPFEVGLSRSA
ncbi:MULTISPECIES: PAS domain-containing methyl-accepting chemotaxis protein [Roseobacteraceae]|uniref:methyl-accepting chemotaxis protein n=1 Tax=Roseobacteraceae TaxID=2854170 RepID=UPI00125F5270|nr:MULTISPECIES: PAS domain-containing methyl-accepting chemotaxis protein [Roseobacteraceae]KAB6715777.1 chemotaxis protein [Roseobacter sp. TSBP12]|tara:strand:+ start:5817 stop:7898 length:2082 start_codon:yes stop_codon:yes gene_type:complete